MENIKLFLLTALVVNATPGVDRIFVFTISLKSGVRSGVFASLGIAISTFIHALLVSTCLYLVIKTNQQIFDYIQLFGLFFMGTFGIYLIIQSFEKREIRNLKYTKRQSFIQGFVIHLLNPIAVLYIVSFIPQFINDSHNFVLWFIALSSLSNCIGFSMNSITALAFGNFEKLFYTSNYIIKGINFFAGFTVLYLVSIRTMEFFKIFLITLWFQT